MPTPDSLFLNLLPHFDEQIFQELPEEECVGNLFLSPYIFKKNFILPWYFLAGSKISGSKSFQMFAGGSPTVFLGHFRCRGSAFIYKSHGIFPLSSVSWFLSLVLCGLFPSGNSRLPLFRDPFLLISSSMLLIFRRPFFFPFLIVLTRTSNVPTVSMQAN